MKLDDIISKFRSALSEADWVQSESISVIIESDSREFKSQVEASLGRSGFAIIIMAPMGSPAKCSLKGGRLAGTTEAPVCLVARGSCGYGEVVSKLNRMIQAILASCKDDVTGIDWGRLGEEESSLTYVVNFDVRTSVSI